MIVVDKGIAAFKLSIEQILRPMVNALSLDLGLRRTFRWVFVIADVNQPILGADFLRHFGLAVDVHNGKLLVTTTKLQVNGIISSSPPPPPPWPLLSCYPSQPIRVILAYYVSHHITTTGPPVSARTRRLSPEPDPALKRVTTGRLLRIF